MYPMNSCAFIVQALLNDRRLLLLTAYLQPPVTIDQATNDSMSDIIYFYCSISITLYEDAEIVTAKSARKVTMYARCRLPTVTKNKLFSGKFVHIGLFPAAATSVIEIVYHKRHTLLKRRERASRAAIFVNTFIVII